MIKAIQDEETLRSYIESFEDQGFAHFQAVYTAGQVNAFDGLHADAVADWRFVDGSDVIPAAVSGLLERYPRHILPAVSHPLLLGFAEAVMGPFVQLDSAVLNVDSPGSHDMHLRPVMWHRDRFGSVPPNVYARPVGVAFLVYLQAMTDEVGPLRVIPGSHREDRLIADEALYEPSVDELLVRTEPGDVVAIHHNLLHSGTRNCSSIDRRFFGFNYNLSTLRQEDNFAGPNCSSLRTSAEKTHDRRLARLLGNDTMIFLRQNSGFTKAHPEQWAEWAREDEEYAAEAKTAGDRVNRVRRELAL